MHISRFLLNSQTRPQLKPTNTYRLPKVSHQQITHQNCISKCVSGDFCWILKRTHNWCQRTHTGSRKFIFFEKRPFSALAPMICDIECSNFLCALFVPSPSFWMFEKIFSTKIFFFRKTALFDSYRQGNQPTAISFKLRSSAVRNIFSILEASVRVHFWAQMHRFVVKWKKCFCSKNGPFRL